jgi:hypothetical protein
MNMSEHDEALGATGMSNIYNLLVYCRGFSYTFKDLGELGATIGTGLRRYLDLTQFPQEQKHLEIKVLKLLKYFVLVTIVGKLQVERREALSRSERRLRHPQWIDHPKNGIFVELERVVLRENVHNFRSLEDGLKPDTFLANVARITV